MKIEEFEQLKASSVGHSLIKAARIFNEYSFKSLQESIGEDRLKPSHLKLFAHISFEGSTVKDISESIGISKQAVSVLVNELLEFKVLIKKENPNDKRSFLVSFNPKGKNSIFEGMKYLKSLDEVFVELLGEKETIKMNKSLNKIIETFESKSKI